MNKLTPQHKARWFAGFLALLLLGGFTLPGLMRAFEERRAEGLVIVQRIDESRVSGASLSLYRENGELLGELTSDQFGEVELGAFQEGWEKMVVSHGNGVLQTGAVVRWPITTWPCVVVLRGVE